MSPRRSGLFLIVASTAFWLCWLAMPGVGVTDTATIFGLVGAHRTSVFVSVCLQLLSAAAYVPAALDLYAAPASSRWVRAGATLLLIGALGSAADAIFHLVAYEMTRPGIDAMAVAPVMRRLQGPDLALLIPFVAAFFAGHVVLVMTLRARGPVARLSGRVLLTAPAILAVGLPLAHAGVATPRITGLAFLAAISASLAIVGASFLAE